MKQAMKTIWTILLVALFAACGVATPTPRPMPRTAESPTPISPTSTPVVDPAVITVENIDRLAHVKYVGMGSLSRSPIYSPDGKWLYLTTMAGVFALDTATYQERRLLVPIANYASTVTLSPDGSILAIDHRLISVKDWQELNSPQIPPRTETGNPISDSRFSPDGTLFAVVYSGDRLDIYRMSDGILLYTLNANFFQFSTDSQLIVITTTANKGSRVELYEAQTGRPLQDWAGERTVFLAARQLAVESKGTIRIYDLATGKVPHAFNGRYPAVSPDGQYMAFLATDHVEIRSIADGKLLHRLDQDLQGVDKLTLNFAPDGQTITIYAYWGACCGGGNSTFSRWNVVDGTLIKDANKKYPYLSPDGQAAVLFTGTGLQILNTSDGSVRATVDGLTRLGGELVFLPEGRKLVAYDGKYGGEGEQPLLIYDVDTGQYRWVRIADLGSIGFSTDQAGKFGNLSPYLFGYWKGDERFNELRSKVIKQGNYSLHSILFSPDGQILATGSRYNGILRLWNIQEQRLLLEQSLCHEKMTSSLAFSPDGRQIASACSDDIWESQGEPNIQVWQVVPEPQPLMQLSGYGYTLVTYSPDGQYIAGAGNHLQVWSAMDGKSIFSVGNDFEDRSILGNGSSGLNVQSVAFSANGEVLAFGLKDGSVELWSVSDGKQLRVLRMSEPNLLTSQRVYNPVLALAFSPDGKWLAIGLEDGSVRLWGIQ